MKNIILLLTGLLLVFSISCTEDYDEINDQPDALSVSDVSAKFFVTTLQQKLYRDNVYELWYGRILHSNMSECKILPYHNSNTLSL